MKKWLFAAIALALISGCSLGVNLIEKQEKALNQLLTQPGISRDCKAGLAVGFVDIGSTNPKTKMASVVASRYADAGSKDYKMCYSEAGFLTFVASGGMDVMQAFLTWAVSVGLLAP
jgi:hypothetical protein